MSRAFIGGREEMILDRYTDLNQDSLNVGDRGVFDKWRGEINRKIQTHQSYLKDVQTLEDLYHVGDFGTFGREFIADIAWLYDVWLRDSEYSIDVYDDIIERQTEIENKLIHLPFEKAICHRDPSFHTKSNVEIIKSVFDDENTDWRFNPEIIRYTRVDELDTIFRRFEYMCYLIINTREELEFDISTAVCS